MKLLHQENKDLTSEYFIVKLSRNEVYELLGADNYKSKEFNKYYELCYRKKYEELKDVWDNFKYTMQEAALLKFHADKIQEMLDKYFKDKGQK